MSIITTIITIVLSLIYMGFIIHAVGFQSLNEMKHKFWKNQPIVGKVLLTIFYLPAWALKFLRIGMDFLVKS